jgi:hypothetical protein
MRGDFTYAPEDIREARQVAVRTNLGRSGNVPNRLRRGVVGWVVFVALSVGLVYLLTVNKRSAPGGTPPPVVPAAGHSLWTDVCLPLIPWAIVVLFLYLVLFRPLRAGRRAQDAALFEPMSLDVSPDGVRLANGPCETRWQWEAFSRFVETDRQFILYIGDTRTWLAIPKHLAADPADLAATRELIAARVQPPVEAFPVLPISVRPSA